MEAAKAEKKRLEASGSAPPGGFGVRKTEIIREYQISDANQKEVATSTSAQTVTSENNKDLDSKSMQPIEKSENQLLNEKSPLIKRTDVISSTNKAVNIQEEIESLIVPVSSVDATKEDFKDCDVEQRRESDGQHLLLAPRLNILEITLPEEDAGKGFIVSKKESPSRDVQALMTFFEMDEANQNNSNILKYPASVKSKSAVLNGGLSVNKTDDDTRIVKHVPINTTDQVKQITFTNSNNVGMTRKLSPQNSRYYYTEKLFDDDVNNQVKTSHFEANSAILEPELSTKSLSAPRECSLKYTSSLKHQRKKKPSFNEHCCTEGQSTVSKKSFSNDSIHNLEFVEDFEFNSQDDISSSFKPKKIRYRKGPLISYSRIVDNKVSTISKISSPDSCQLKTIIINRGNALPQRREIKHSSKNELSITETKLNHRDLDQTRERQSLIQRDIRSNIDDSTVIDILSPDSCDQIFPSIKDEIDPDPRPERTQSVRSKTRRRSSRKAHKSKFKVMASQTNDSVDPIVHSDHRDSEDASPYESDIGSSVLGLDPKQNVSQGNRQSIVDNQGVEKKDIATYKS